MNEYEDIKDFSIITVCAFRYALGRRTYITDIVPEFIRNNIERIWTKDIKLMIKEIEESTYLGDTCDIESWLSLKKFLKDELSRRKEDR